MGSSSSPILEPSPTDMKKQLIELFQESFRDDAIDGNQNIQERSKANPTFVLFLQNLQIKAFMDV